MWPLKQPFYSHGVWSANQACDSTAQEGRADRTGKRLDSERNTIAKIKNVLFFEKQGDTETYANTRLTPKQYTVVHSSSL